MITKQPAFMVTDGALFASVEAAQLHELTHFLDQDEFTKDVALNPKALAELLLANKDKLVDLLTMKASSHPKARKANGATRKTRTAKPTATQEAMKV